jgi:hypothetical protein
MIGAEDQKRAALEKSSITGPVTEGSAISAGMEQLRLRAQQLSLREQLERHHFLLERLSVSSTRLLQSLQSGDVLEAIAEIIATLVGSEEIAIFDYCPRRQNFSVVKAWGVGNDTAHACARGGGMLEAAAQRGASQFREIQGTESALLCDKDLTACVLLKSSKEIIGAIAIFKLLPQKQKLEWADFELLKFFEVYGGVAIQIQRLQRNGIAL